MVAVLFLLPRMALPVNDTRASSFADIAATRARTLRAAVARLVAAAARDTTRRVGVARFDVFTGAAVARGFVAVRVTTLRVGVARFGAVATGAAVARGFVAVRATVLRAVEF